MPALLLVLAGCAVIPERTEWPTDMPPLPYYRALYQGDAENRQQQSLAKYLKWARAFYDGWGGIRGWRSIREEILADADPAIRDNLRRGLSDLGRRISGEWAKGYGQRRISNREIQIWINAAYKASEAGDHDHLLEKISGDVDDLLKGSLDPSEITPGRYYPDREQRSPLGDFDFATEQQGATEPE